MEKKIYSFVCLCLLFTSVLFAQDTIQSPTLKNEISISSRTFNDLSLKYARFISDDFWLKVGVINLEKSSFKSSPNVGIPNSPNTSNSSYNGGLLLGIEKHQFLNHWEFTFGLNAQMIYNKSNYTTDNPNVPVVQRDINVFKYIPGVGLGLGFFYTIYPSILLGFEINPSINYAFINGESTIKGYAFKDDDFYLSFVNSGGITLKYKF